MYILLHVNEAIRIEEYVSLHLYLYFIILAYIVNFVK